MHGETMPEFDIEIMKNFVREYYPPGSPLREVILQDKGGEISYEVLIAKGRIWFQLMRLEEHIEYRIKDKYRRMYR
jgi:hypothetical protein